MLIWIQENTTTKERTIMPEFWLLLGVVVIPVRASIPNTKFRAGIDNIGRDCVKRWRFVMVVIMAIDLVASALMCCDMDGDVLRFEVLNVHGSQVVVVVGGGGGGGWWEWFDPVSRHMRCAKVTLWGFCCVVSIYNFCGVCAHLRGTPW